MRLALIALAALTLATPATAKRVDCDEPVDAIARIGLPDRFHLSVTEDNDARECRFSVEGVATGSPPQDALDEAARALGNPETLIPLVDGDPDTLATFVALMLAAASPFEDADEVLLTPDFGAFVRDCFARAFDSGGVSFIDSTNFSETICALIQPGDAGNFNDSVTGGRVRLSDFDSPQLVFTHRRSDAVTEHFFFGRLPF